MTCYISRKYAKLYTHTNTHTHTHTHTYTYLYANTVTEFKAVDNLGEKNRMIGQRWGGLNKEDKERYKSMAKDVPHPDTLEPGTTWKETSRIISNFEANVCKYTCVHISGS